MRARLSIGSGAIVATVVAVVAITSGSGKAAHTLALPSPVVVAFGQHYDGLVARREAAHVPTMMQTMSSSVHFHPLIKVFVDGTPMPIPANIGIDPNVDGMQMAGLHTHDTSGTIHVEGVAPATLGQFFAIWGVAFSARQLGPYHSGAGKSVRVWVDGKPSTADGALKLANRQHIVVSFGPTSTPAPS